MESLNEFGWLAKENVTSHQKVIKICSEIPAKRKAFFGSHLVPHSVKLRLRSG